MTTNIGQNTIIPGCRWVFRRFLRAQRAYRSAEANLAVIAEHAPGTDEHIEARRLLGERERVATTRRAELVECLARMGRPESDMINQPEIYEPYDAPVPLPPGVTEEMDEADDAPPAVAERCGAPSKNFARYGYCDRLASKDGNYCYQHA